MTPNLEREFITIKTLLFKHSKLFFFLQRQQRTDKVRSNVNYDKTFPSGCCKVRNNYMGFNNDFNCHLNYAILSLSLCHFTLYLNSGQYEDEKISKFYIFKKVFPFIF